MRLPMFFREGDGGAPSGGGGAGDGSAASATLLGGAAGDGSGGQPPAVVPPASGGWTWAKEDGSLDPAWRDRLPDDLKSAESLRVINSIPDLAKSYVATKALIGKKLEAPGENATPEQIASWRKTVGAPDKPEGYRGDAKSLRPEAIPEQHWNVENEGKFLAIAHKHHLNPAAVKEILGFYGESIQGGLEAAKAQEGAILQGESTKLRGAWGKDFDTNLATASRVAQTVGLDPKTHPIFTSAEVVQAFAKMGKLLSEDRLVQGDAGGVNGSITARIQDITDSKSTSQLAREYRGEHGPERQAAAQKQYHDLLSAQQAQK